MVVKDNKKLVVTDIHIEFKSGIASNGIFLGKNTTVNETIKELSKIIDSENNVHRCCLGISNIKQV